MGRGLTRLPVASTAKKYRRRKSESQFGEKTRSGSVLGDPTKHPSETSNPTFATDSVLGFQCLYGSQSAGSKRLSAEVEEFRETKDQHLIPSNKFTLEFDVTGESGISSGDFVVWTTIDFLVA